MFRNTSANAFAKNQMRLAYEDKRDVHIPQILALLDLVLKYIFLYILKTNNYIED